MEIIHDVTLLIIVGVALNYIDNLIQNQTK
jgi:hypothetical protein